MDIIIIHRIVTIDQCYQVNQMVSGNDNHMQIVLRIKLIQKKITSSADNKKHFIN